MYVDINTKKLTVDACKNTSDKQKLTIIPTILFFLTKEQQKSLSSSLFLLEPHMNIDDLVLVNCPRCRDNYL